jgi:hypothetical protein
MKLELKVRLSEKEIVLVDWLRDRLTYIELLEQIVLKVKITNVTKSWGSTGINPNAGVNGRMDHTMPTYPEYLRGSSTVPYGEISLNWAGFRNTTRHQSVIKPSYNKMVAGDSFTDADRKRLLMYFVWAVYFVKTGVKAKAREAYDDRENVVARWQDPLWEFVQGRPTNIAV